MLAVALLLGTLTADLRAAATLANSAIRGEAISSHVRFLADDLLEGRGTGTRGHAIAARYVATTLQSFGVTPAGDNGGWFQSIPMRTIRGRVDKTTLHVVDAHGKALKLVRDTDLIGGPAVGERRADISGPLVFGAYSISAPKLGYDDVPTDVKGKIVVVLFGAPGEHEGAGSFPSAAGAVYSDLDEKARRLASRGAAGLIVVASPAIMQEVPWPAFVNQSRLPSSVWMDGDRPGQGFVLPGMLTPPQTLDKLLAAAGRKERAADLFAQGAAGTLKPFDLPLRATFHAECDITPAHSQNVVGILRGSDPARAGEYVAITAHLDGLGIGPAINGDNIYNGADDDGEGIAEMLEIARAASRHPPPRSLLFLAVTGEESGLQGSDFFARHPTVPIGDIVADVNVDHGAGPVHEPHDIVAFGAEHSSLAAPVKAVLATIGWKQSPDPNPERVYFIRSDQYSFVKRGVPSVMPMIGYLDGKGDPKKNQVAEDAYGLSRYHQPTDEWDSKRNWEWAAQETRAYYMLVAAIADEPQRPRWNKGDIFETMFAQPAH